MLASLAGTRSASSEFFLLILIQEKREEGGVEGENQHARETGQKGGVKSKGKTKKTTDRTNK